MINEQKQKWILKDSLLLNLINVSIFVSFVSVLIYFLISFRTATTGPIIVRLAYLVLTAGLFFLASKKPRLSSYIFLISTEIFTAFTYLHPQFSTTASFVWIAIVPIFAIFLLGKWAGLINTLLFSALIFVVFLTKHLPGYNIFTRAEFYQLSMFLVTITVIMFYFEHVWEKMQTRSRIEHENRLKLEQMLRDYEQAIESSVDIIIMIDKALNIVMVNQAFLDRRNLPRADVLGHSVASVLTKAEYQEITPYLERCFNGEKIEFEATLERKVNPNIRVLFYPAFNKVKQIHRIVCIARDITREKLLQNERQRLFELSIDALCIAGFDGRFKDINPAWERMLGWSRDDMMKKPWLELVHPDDREQTIEAGKVLMQGKEIINFENRYLCKDGSYRWVSWNSFSDFKLQQIIAVVRDVTAQKELEAERVELIGKLQNALNEVNTLQGIIPICSHCKKIRDEAGAWNQLEAYISKHSEAKFSHGICPECAEKHYPEYKHK